MAKKFMDDADIVGGFYTHEDATCSVTCSCNDGSRAFLDPIWVSDSKIARCPRCGRGYKTEFIVWQYEPGEEDA